MSTALEKPQVQSRMARLVEDVQTLMNQHVQLLLIDAPVGYGKSALLEEMFLAGNLPAQSLWLKVESDAPDSSDTAARGEMAGSLPDQVQDLLHWGEAAMGSAAIVVEDYSARPDGEVAEALLELLSIRNDLVVVYVSRTLSQVGVDALALPLRVFRFGPADLGYTRSEIVGAASEDGVILPAAVIDFLCEFGGWPVLVASAIGDLKGVPTPAKSQGQVDKLSQRVLDLAGSRLSRQVLAAVALCPGIDSEFLGTFLDRPVKRVEAAAQKLRDLGLIALDSADGLQSFSVPEQFQPGMEHVARLQWPLAEIDTLHNQFASHVAHTRPTDAVSCYLNMDDLSAVDKIVGRDFATLLFAGLGHEASTSVGRRIAQLPLRAVRSYPSLLAFRLKLGALDDRLPLEDSSEAALWVEDAFSGPSEGQSPLTKADLVAQMISARALGSSERLARLVEEAELCLASEGEEFFANPAERSLFLTELSLCYLSLEATEDASRVTKEAKTAAKDGGSPTQQAYVSSLLTLLHCYRFDLQAAEHEYLEAKRLLKSSGETVPELFWANAKVGFLLLSAFHAVLGGDQATAETLEYLNQQAERLERYPDFLVGESGFIRRRDGSAAARVRLKDQLELGSSNWRATDREASSLRARLANLAMYDGEYVEAANALSAPGGPMFQAEVNARARLALLRGDPVGCLQIIWSAGPAFGFEEPNGSGALLAALSLYVSGEDAQATGWFNQIVQTVDQERLIVELSSVPYAPLRELANLARQTGGADIVDQVDALLENHRVQYYQPLSKAELELARKLEAGGTLAEVANSLYISHNTAKSHLRRVYQKLEVNNRREAAIMLNRLYPDRDD